MPLSQMKICASCHETKPSDAFPIDRARPDGRYPYCRICHSTKEKERWRSTPEKRAKKAESTRRWLEANRERQRYLARRSHLRRKYGLTPEEFEALLNEQDNRCALCQGEDPRSQTGWHLDHDHETGRIRGILCQPCNHLIGLIEAGWSMPTRDGVASYAVADPTRAS